MVARSHTAEQLTELAQDLEAKVQHYLRERGWAYECNFPGSYWLWVKQVGDRILAVQQDMAVEIQGHLDLN